MRRMLRITILSLLFHQACKPSTLAHDAEIQGALSALEHIKPIREMRSATELHALRRGLISSRRTDQAFQASKAPEELLRGLIIKNIVETKGLPRSQLKSVLENIVSSKSSRCQGSPCDRIFGLAPTDIDDFLDKTLANLRYTPENKDHIAMREQVIASLLRSDAEDKNPWIVTLMPDPEAKLWTQKTPYSSALYPDFPAKKSENNGIDFTNELRAILQWGPKQDEQLAEWKKIFDEVENCETRAIKRGKPYATFNECLSEASLDDRQFLSAQLVYREIEEQLANKKSKINPKRSYRAVVDKQGNMQCLVAVNKMPSVRYYEANYKGAIPINAAQIPALEVAYLLAAPWNLHQNHPKRVKGAGTACLGLAALESKRSPWGGRIILEASPSAVPYYKKMGFSATGEHFDKDYGLLPTMWLEPKAAEKLIPAHLK